MNSVSKIGYTVVAATLLALLNAQACSFDDNPVKKAASSKDSGAAKDSGTHDSGNEEPVPGDSSVMPDGGQ